MPICHRPARAIAARNSGTAHFLAFAVLAFATAATTRAQFAPPSQGTQILDSSALHPPGTARVAIVEFEDQQCPACAFNNPLIKKAAAQYKIPWIRHDFPLPYHAWSFQAAVNARYFDTKSKKIGDDYRDQVFANQPSITTLEVLRQFTEKFANSYKVGPLPFAIDPQGTFTAQVKADQALGQRIGIDHTPTIWVVTSQSRGAPFIEVLDPGKLYQIIDQALADTKPRK
jgi:protein-disulfide isomerase